MKICPLCGEKNNNENFSFRKFTIASPCNSCTANLQKLTTAVTDEERIIALKWAKEIIETKYNPPATDALKAIYSLSFSEKTNNQHVTGSSSGAATNNSYGNDFNSTTSQQFYQNYAVTPQSVKTSRTNIVRTMVILSYVFITLGGGITGAVIGEFGGFLLGALAGFISALITNSVIMMFVEISENTAINARTNLENKALLTEIRDSIKNSEK